MFKYFGRLYSLAKIFIDFFRANLFKCSIMIFLSCQLYSDIHSSQKIIFVQHYTACFTLYIELCTLHILRGALHITHFILHTSHCSMHTFQDILQTELRSRERGLLIFRREGGDTLYNQSSRGKSFLVIHQINFFSKKNHPSGTPLQKGLNCTIPVTSDCKSLHAHHNCFCCSNSQASPSPLGERSFAPGFLHTGRNTTRTGDIREIMNNLRSLEHQKSTS